MPSHTNRHKKNAAMPYKKMNQLDKNIKTASRIIPTGRNLFPCLGDAVQSIAPALCYLYIILNNNTN